jgi:hypothetical protein
LILQGEHDVAEVVEVQRLPWTHATVVWGYSTMVGPRSAPTAPLRTPVDRRRGARRQLAPVHRPLVVDGDRRGGCSALAIGSSGSRPRTVTRTALIIAPASV